MYQTLLTKVENKTLIITINRPDKMNALNQTVLNELSEVIDEIYNNIDIRSAIITGAGEKAYVAGADISEFQSLSVDEAKELSKKGQDLFYKIEQCPKPVIACVNGFALGGGCELAMSCHFRIASENAKFGQPEINLGIIPGYGGTQRLAQLIGKGLAMEMLLTGKMIDAQTALQKGLVNSITTLGNLIKEAMSVIEIINSKSPLSVAKCIAACNAFYEKDANGYNVELNEFAQCFSTEDTREGVSAFLDKRKPNFSGR